MTERAKAQTGKAPALSANHVYALSMTVWKSVFAGTVHALSTNNIHALSKSVREKCLGECFCWQRAETAIPKQSRNS
ncbi:hypothetical protein [Bartonella apis]|uniref:hypothetical protein n=1 Tax=Bartonella apis TaxID=1686310 RepID=UPI003BB5DC24